MNGVRIGIRRTGNEAEADAPSSEALDYLPLALDQAAVYMAAPGAGVGFAGYLRLLG